MLIAEETDSRAESKKLCVMPSANRREATGLARFPITTILNRITLAQMLALPRALTAIASRD